MARSSFRVYQKKRGHRRTGSQLWAGVGEVLFFAFLLLLGCVFLYFVNGYFLPAWRVHYQFAEGTCKVLDKRVAQKPDSDPPHYRPEVQIEYQVSGTTYTAWAYSLPNDFTAGQAEKNEILKAFAVEQEYACWYDPDHPQNVVLSRGILWRTGLWFIVPMTFVILGGVGLAYSLLQFGTSAERRSALIRRAGRIDLFEANGQKRHDHPSVPDAAAVTDSPGTTLAFRLPIRTSPAWFLFWLGAGAVVWNVIVSLFVAAAAGSVRAGLASWGPVVGLIPFVLIGLWLIGYFVYRLLIANGIGPTLLEISAHPLVPGGTYPLFVSQSGRLKMKSFDVLLVSEEEATYRQGTDLRVERRRIYEQSLLHREDLEIQRGTPFEVPCELSIPDKAMHSFKAVHNEICWKLIVAGQPVGWPRYQREFPVIVYPAAVDPAVIDPAVIDPSVGESA